MTVTDATPTGALQGPDDAPRSIRGMTVASQRLLVVTPVYNEIDHIERVVDGVAAQTRPPDEWIVVDDGSTDETGEFLRACEDRLPYMRVIANPPVDDLESARDRLALAAAPRAFNAGAGQAVGAFTHVAKLDGDIELPPDYFAKILARLDEDRSLGIACGDLIEPAATGWTRLAIPQHHVHGALKLYSTDCLDAIGGVRECLGWDTIDETYARMRGFGTRSYPDLVAKHLRPAGTADGALRGRARHGRCAWIAHFSLGWVAMRSLKVAIRMRPRGLSGAAFFAGYLYAAMVRVPRVEDREFRNFVRAELRGRMRAALRLRTS
jgi:poly-beta-1,6-N-acetyl-D-glucosamine synthase